MKNAKILSPAIGSSQVNMVLLLLAVSFLRRTSDWMTVNAFMEANFCEKSCRRLISHLNINVWLEWHCWGNCFREFHIKVILGLFHCQTYVHLSKIYFGCGFKSVPQMQDNVAFRSCRTSYFLHTQPKCKICHRNLNFRVDSSELGWHERQNK